MIDPGEFICKTKIKYGNLIVKAHRNTVGRNKNKHVEGTPQLTQYVHHRQTDWPPNRLLNGSMENAFHAIKQELADLADTHFNSAGRDGINHNPTQKEYNSLKKDHSLVIKKGDKTSCIVAKSRKGYLREGMVHLSDEKTYKRLNKDYTPEVQKYITYTLEQYRRGGLLSDYMVRQCMPKTECRTALLYYLTKTHKTPMTLRPMVRSVTENLVAFLDHYLQALYRAYQPI